VPSRKPSQLVSSLRCSRGLWRCMGKHLQRSSCSNSPHPPVPLLTSDQGVRSRGEVGRGVVVAGITVCQLDQLLSRRDTHGCTRTGQRANHPRSVGCLGRHPPGSPPMPRHLSTTTTRTGRCPHEGEHAPLPRPWSASMSWSSPQRETLETIRHRSSTWTRCGSKRKMRPRTTKGLGVARRPHLQRCRRQKWSCCTSRPNRWPSQSSALMRLTVQMRRVILPPRMRNMDASRMSLVAACRGRKGEAFQT